jgi:hypothetical protein
MLKLFSAALLPALLLSAGAAGAQTAAPTGREATIPFITHGQVRTFEADRDGRGVYIQNSRRDWYYARFFTRCNELPFAFRVGFQTFGGSSTLSRGDTILAGRERCRIASIVRSGPPPKKAKKPNRS